LKLSAFGAKNVSSPFGRPACPVGRLMVRHAHHDKNIRLRSLKKGKWFSVANNISTGPSRNQDVPVTFRYNVRGLVAAQ